MWFKAVLVSPHRQTTNEPKLGRSNHNSTDLCLTTKYTIGICPITSGLYHSTHRHRPDSEVRFLNEKLTVTHERSQ